MTAQNGQFNIYFCHKDEIKLQSNYFRREKKNTNTAQKEGGGRDFGPMIFKMTSVPKRIHVQAWMIRPSLKGINVIGGRDGKYSSF